MPKAPVLTGNLSCDLRHAPRRRNGKLTAGPAIKARVNRNNKDTPAAGSSVKKVKEELVPDFKTWVKNKKLPIEYKEGTLPVKTETPVPVQPGGVPMAS